MWCELGGESLCTIALQLHATEDEAAKTFRKLIKESLNTKRTRFNDACHLLKHG